MDVGHSRLLKFFTKSRHKADEMAEETPVIKIHKDFESPPNVEAEVPGTHTIREVDGKDKNIEDAASSTSETQIIEEFSSTPVITVTKKESTLTKGDMKMQKVTVTEDISVAEDQNGGHRVSHEIRSYTDGESGRKSVTRVRRKKTVREGEMDTEEKSQEEKKSKIPIMRLRQAVEKVKKERLDQKSRVKPRRSSIPKLKDAKVAIKRDTSLQIHPRPEDEFDKLYDEIIDDKQKDIDDKILAIKVEDTEKVESKFEEIIHAYDEAANGKQSVSRISKIPALRRRDDNRPSKIGALVDKVKVKNTVTESKLKDGGFKVTASNIKTKRFSRNNSNMSVDDQNLEVTENIDIKETFDNGVLVTETIKKAPVKPKRSIRSISKEYKKDGDIINIVKTIEDTEDGGNVETINKTIVKETVRTSIPIKTEKIIRGVSEDMKIDHKNTDNKETVTVTEVKDGDSRTITTTTTVKENIILGPTVKTERIIHGISREINEDLEYIEGTTNCSNKETVTIKEFKDGDNHTITTKTILKETVKVGTPVITETIIRNASSEMNTEGDNINTIKDKDIKSNEIITIKPIRDEGSTKITKETILKENIKVGIPIKTERFTRGISREMGNLKQPGKKEMVNMDEVKNDSEKSNSKVITKEKVSGIPVNIEKVIHDNNLEIIKDKPNPDIIYKQIADNGDAIKVTPSQTNDDNKKEMKSDDTKHGIKTQTMETENILKESIKVGIPVFTKVTQSFSKGRIQNVEMSRTIEWKPADEVKTNNYKRSISEKVTTKELKDIGNWKFRAPIDDSKDTDSIHNNDVAHKEKHKDSILQDNGKENKNEIMITNITEYESREQETNVEKQTYTLSKTVDLTVERETKGPREMRKQMSLIDSIRRDADSKQVSKEYSTELNKDYIIDARAVTETNETRYSNISTPEIDPDNEEVTILKGNVSRLKNKISKIENVGVPKKEIDNELPQKKSVLSKIAIFERQEPIEAYPIVKKIHTQKYIPKLVPKEINIEESPKIVEDKWKERPISDSNHDKEKVEIDLSYEEVAYKNKPVIVEEFWKTEKGNVPIVSTVNQVIAENTNIQRLENMIRVDQNVLEKSDFDDTKTTPAIIDYSTNEIQVETISAPPMEPELELNRNKPKVSTDSLEKHNYKTQEYDAPIIVSTKKKLDSEIGKTRPGKIDFNIWKNQVEVNKTLVDKKDILKGESLGEIAKTLPGKTLLRTFEKPVQLSKAPPKTQDSKLNETGADLPGQPIFGTKDVTLDVASASSGIQYSVTKTLTGEVESETEIDKALPNRIDIKSDDDIITKQDIEVNKLPTDTPETLSSKPEFSTQKNQTVLPKILPDKKDLQEKHYIKTSEKEVDTNKPTPGKLNLNLWKNQVEANKTFVGKHKKKEVEITKGLPSKIDFKSYDNQNKVSMALPGRVDLRTSENGVENTQIETNRPLPGKIHVSTTQSQVEEIIDSPGLIKISTIESLDDNAKTWPGNNTALPDDIEFETCEYKVEEIEFLPVTIDFSTTEYQSEVVSTSTETFETNETKIKVATTLPGKLDLAAWKKQVEVNKTPVGTVVNKTEKQEVEMIKSLPGKVDFITYESQTEESNILHKKSQIAYENNVPQNFYMGTPKNKEHRCETVQDTKDLKTGETNVETRYDPGPKESLSDPELVDEPENEVKENKDSIIGKIKKKMYFITNKSIIQNSTNQPIQAEISVISDSNESNYEKKVEDMRMKTYVINDKNMVQNTMNKTESIEQIVTTETSTTTTYIKDECNKTIEENHKEIDSRSNNNVSGKEYLLNAAQNNSNIEIIPTEHNEHIDEDIEIKTTENVFEFDTNKAQNELTRSAYGAEDFKTTREDLKRAKSLAELDLGDIIHGQVRRMVGRMKSVDFDRRESVKVEKISTKEMPKKMSVLEKIALFEGKSSPSQSESINFRTRATKKNDTKFVSEEVYLQKIEELTTAKTRLGRLEDMLYLHLANGAEMPVIALGTALTDKRLLPHLIGAAIDLGYRAIDTAFIYDNEKEIGQAIKAKIDDGTVKREDLFIISKLWSTYHRPDLVEEACKTSLKNMGLEYFDLYLIHNPMSFKEGTDPIPKIATVLQYSQYDYLDAWFGMETLVSKQLVKNIGVSNFNSQQIQRILDKGKLKPVVNQVECHPYLSQQRLHTFCSERNITLSCFGVLGSKGTPAEYKSAVNPVIDDALIQVMASGLNVSPAQLLIRYQIECGHNVVVKASTGAHLWDNLQALTFTLDKTQVDALHALNRNKRIFTFKGMGDTHKNYPFLAGY